MSLYQLTIEPGTVYFDLHAKGSLIVPDEDSATDLFELTQTLTEKHGLSAYEVSNHASEGQESRHNLLYWRYGEYVGVGPGAHARIAEGENRRAIVMEKYPETWRKLVNEKGHGIVEDSSCCRLTRLRNISSWGSASATALISRAMKNLRGQSMDPNKIAGLKSLGLVKREGPRLMATTQGRRLLNALITELAN